MRTAHIVGFSPLWDHCGSNGVHGKLTHDSVSRVELDVCNSLHAWIQSTVWLRERRLTEEAHRNSSALLILSVAVGFSNTSSLRSFGLLLCCHECTVLQMPVPFTVLKCSQNYGNPELCLDTPSSLDTLKPRPKYCQLFRPFGKSS